MPESKAQVRAAYAALHGKSKAGMPEKVAREIISKTHARGGTKGLPERVGKGKEKHDGKNLRKYKMAGR